MILFYENWKRRGNYLKNHLDLRQNHKTPYEAFEELTGVDIKNLLGYALMT
jgi:hypothetical protein